MTRRKGTRERQNAQGRYAYALQAEHVWAPTSAGVSQASSLMASRRKDAPGSSFVAAAAASAWVGFYPSESVAGFDQAVTERTWALLSLGLRRLA